MVVVRALRGGRITIVINREQRRIVRVVIVVILDHLLVMIMIHQIDRKRASEGVGRVGLTAGVQGSVHHGHWRLNHEHGDQHHGQSRHAFPKLVVHVLKQVSLEAVVTGDIVVASSA
ncbi:hypothetical protein [Caulobacter sp.]|uniref:hypothetical protein n=1 Tax=Caulobacter sp. TaxID=78 RepID=UPI003BB01E42